MRETAMEAPRTDEQEAGQIRTELLRVRSLADGMAAVTGEGEAAGEEAKGRAETTPGTGEAGAVDSGPVAAALLQTLIPPQCRAQRDGHVPPRPFGALASRRACRSQDRRRRRRGTGRAAEGEPACRARPERASPMLERLARVCVGLGLLWVVGVIAVGLLAGLDRPERWLALPYLDSLMGGELRRAIYMVLTVGVVPVGMLTVLRDVYRDPGPLWLKAAAPGGFGSVYALFLAAALPRAGQPLLQAADPLVAQFLPWVRLTTDPGDPASWLLRFGVIVALFAGVPWALGLVAGGLAGGPPRRA
jgi:hypothetical protein